MLGLCCCIGFSLVVASGGYSLVIDRLLIAVASLVAKHRLRGVGASVVVALGLSNWGSPEALEHRLDHLWCLGLVALWHVESSQTRDWTHVPCICRWILYHWATQEAPLLIFLNIHSEQFGSIHRAGLRHPGIFSARLTASSWFMFILFVYFLMDQVVVPLWASQAHWQL